MGLNDTPVDTPQFTIDCTIINASGTQLIQNSVKRSITVPFILEAVDCSPLPKFFKEIALR
jgi:hypothetical protein